jgi:hypothetical protein
MVVIQRVERATRIREYLQLETLEERRLSLRLILMYKVVEGLVPALCSISGRLRFGVLNMDCPVRLVVCVFLVGNI